VQARASVAPQAVQNFFPSAFSAPQLEQSISSEPNAPVVGQLPLRL
jgi:siroheme synthase (precorrin-2 oxidase/ferrochelatase)